MVRIRLMLCSKTRNVSSADGSCQCLLEDRIGLGDNGLTLVRQCLPNFFGDKGHERMKQSQEHFKRILERLSGCRTLRMQRILEDRLDQFKVPVAVLVPEELVESAGRSIKPIGFQLHRHNLDGVVQPASYP